MKTLTFTVTLFLLLPFISSSQIYFVPNTFYTSSATSAIGGYNVIGQSGGSSVYGSFASGYSNKINQAANASIVFGDNCTVGGYASLAAGSFSVASGSNSFALGQFVSATAASSMVIGLGRWNATKYAGNFVNNISNLLMVSFNSTTTAATAPSIFVGPVGTYGGYTYGAGCVGIGTTDTKGYLFAVNGYMIATKIKVATYANWPDYVFQKNYPLLPLNEVADFINKNHHLPEIENAADVKGDGYDIADMDAKLLKKIEELYIYVINLKRENEILNAKVTAFEKTGK